MNSRLDRARLACSRWCDTKLRPFLSLLLIPDALQHDIADDDQLSEILVAIDEQRTDVISLLSTLMEAYYQEQRIRTSLEKFSATLQVIYPSEPCFQIAQQVSWLTDMAGGVSQVTGEALQLMMRDAKVFIDERSLQLARDVRTVERHHVRQAMVSYQLQYSYRQVARRMDALEKNLQAVGQKLAWDGQSLPSILEDSDDQSLFGTILLEQRNDELIVQDRVNDTDTSQEIVNFVSPQNITTSIQEIIFLKQNLSEITQTFPDSAGNKESSQRKLEEKLYGGQQDFPSKNNGGQAIIQKESNILSQQLSNPSMNHVVNQNRVNNDRLAVLGQLTQCTRNDHYEAQDINEKTKKGQFPTVDATFQQSNDQRRTSQSSPKTNKTNPSTCESQLTGDSATCESQLTGDSATCESQLTGDSATCESQLTGDSATCESQLTGDSASATEKIGLATESIQKLKNEPEEELDYIKQKVQRTDQTIVEIVQEEQQSSSERIIALSETIDMFIEDSWI